MNTQDRLLDLTPQLAQLAQLTQGSYQVHKSWWKFNARGGWLTVDMEAKNPLERSIMWTTHKDSHNAMSEAYSITVDQAGQLLHFCESALTMHTKWSKGLRDDEYLDQALDIAQWMHKALCAPILERYNRGREERLVDSGEPCDKSFA